MEKLIVFEGIDGCGKSTVRELLQNPGFWNDELRFSILNYFGAKFFPPLDSGLPQKGGIFLPGEGMTKFNVFGDLINGVMQVVRKNKVTRTPQDFWAMVAGIGIVGKATTRTVLTKELMNHLPESVVLSLDLDYQKLSLDQLASPQLGESDCIKVVEDVHGLDIENGRLERFDGKEGLPRGYDLVVYVLPVPKTYRQSLLNRGASWIKQGKIDLTDPRRKTPETLEGTIEDVARELERTSQVGQNWYKENLTALRELKERGVPTIVVDPTGFFKVAYGFKEEEGVLATPFNKLLQRRFGLVNEDII